MICTPEPEYGLEFLLAFDGRIHHLEEGYWIKFEIARVKGNHGATAWTVLLLHAARPDGTRLVGFGNAHGVSPEGSRFKRALPANDHWHRTETDPRRPYQFKNAEGLIGDFFDEVERVAG
jgi:hypothetical protein